MPDFGDEGMPYWDEIPWHMSQQNPTGIDIDDDLARLRESAHAYRDVLSAAFDALHRQRSYIVTLHGQIASLQNRRSS